MCIDRASVLLHDHAGAASPLQPATAASTPAPPYPVQNKETLAITDDTRIRASLPTLQHLATLALDVVTLTAASPFALPLMVERLREQLSTEKLKDRLDRMLAESEAALVRGAGLT